MVDILKNTGRSEAEDLIIQKYYARERARLDAVSRIKYAEIKGIEKGREDLD